MNGATYLSLSSDRHQIVELLGSTGEARKSLFVEAARVKREHVGDLVYFRGLQDMPRSPYRSDRK